MKQIKRKDILLRDDNVVHWQYLVISNGDEKLYDFGLEFCTDGKLFVVFEEHTDAKLSLYQGSRAVILRA